ncbi:biliverdin-producing heme oxygenase [Roseobacter sp. HKCCA0434]|uniref:biliverdin-producing heme oxygenase n=1 Tax=Roseobacter sp. HKCCA0434 TaxID=3079297 RepID=UPI002905D446|nr:biliverdin-producing heme oxygenase [Roseobacter sp. HKCCA0434]
MLDSDTFNRTAQSDLRAILRRGTRAAHERLDARVEALDIASESGLTVMLRASRDALVALRPALDRLDLPSAAPLQAAIARDLDTLCADPGPRLTLRYEGAPLGAYYVVAGSRLGAQVLSRDHAVRATGRARYVTSYLDAPEGMDMWKAFLAYPLSAQTDATATLAGANAAFGIFQEAFDHHIGRNT